MNKEVGVIRKQLYTCISNLSSEGLIQNPEVIMVKGCGCGGAKTHEAESLLSFLTSIGRLLKSIP